MIKVYVAGPYTHGDTAENVKIAINIADRLLEHGCSPFVPHLFHFWHLMHEHDYDTWMNLGTEWLKQCDVVLRLPGFSPGADKEVDIARQYAKHVYFSIDELIHQVKLSTS